MKDGVWWGDARWPFSTNSFGGCLVWQEMQRRSTTLFPAHLSSDCIQPPETLSCHNNRLNGLNDDGFQRCWSLHTWVRCCQQKNQLWFTSRLQTCRSEMICWPRCVSAPMSATCLESWRSPPSFCKNMSAWCAKLPLKYFIVLRKCRKCSFLIFFCFDLWFALMLEKNH